MNSIFFAVTIPSASLRVIIKNSFEEYVSDTSLEAIKSLSFSRISVSDEASSFRYNDFYDEKLNFKYNRNIIVSLPVDLEASLSIL